MTAPGSGSVRTGRGAAPRRRHWLRWTLIGVAAIAVVVIVAVVGFVKLQPVPAPLALPATQDRAPVGPAAGTWLAGAGSQAGFRVKETTLGVSNDTVGRTTGVAGAIVISGDQVTRATFRIDLAAVKVNGKAQPQFAKSLDTQADPRATFTLSRPVTLGPAFASGAVGTIAVTGLLAMHGTSRQVTFTIRCRRDGPVLEAVGSVPVSFSLWGISGPQGFGFIGSLANHGVAEFLLIMHRASGTG